MSDKGSRTTTPKTGSARSSKAGTPKPGSKAGTPRRGSKVTTPPIQPVADGTEEDAEIGWLIHRLM